MVAFVALVWAAHLSKEIEVLDAYRQRSVEREVRILTMLEQSTEDKRIREAALEMLRRINEGEEP